MSTPKAASQLLDKYLSQRSYRLRLDVLARMRADAYTIPIDVAEDLFQFKLERKEMMALADMIDASDTDRLENLYLKHLADAHQDLGAVLLGAWYARTPHLQFETLQEVWRVQHLPQRIRYRMIDLAPGIGGAALLETALEFEDLESHAPTFQGLFLWRALQLGVFTPRLEAMAYNLLVEHAQDDLQHDRGVSSALSYLLCANKDRVSDLLKSENLPDGHEPWVSVALRQMQSADDPSDWPEIWNRKHLSPAAVQNQLNHQLQEADKHKKPRWTKFAAIPELTLVEALVGMEDRDKSLKALTLVFPLLRLPLTQNVKNHFKNTSLEHQTLPELLKAQLKNNTKSKVSPTKEASPREKFFQRLRQQDAKGVPTSGSDSYWDLLCLAWDKPSVEILEKLSTQARQAPGVWQLCYLRTLARFEGINEACLKLLDYIRTEDTCELEYILEAFRGIGTPRAAMELIAALTRPNITLSLQIKVSRFLRDFELDDLQAELRSALNDIRSTLPPSEDFLELRDNLTSLIHSEPTVESKKKLSVTAGETASKLEAAHLDVILGAKISHFGELSSEIKRALRTALFFQEQIGNTKDRALIDISPVLDMQYKALELLFREYFEDFCQRSLQSGELQHRLDLIGYARPMEHLMAQFEGYVANLPIICNIPFFSKFKLRKMLRAICVYRPGKRFTLDGLKAFALYFLSFSRHECRFGLANQFPIGYSNDRDLFTFCRKLHVFQDSRNRAAHEGFQPSALSDMEEIWALTGDIIKEAQRIRNFLRDPSTASSPRPKNKSSALPPAKVQPPSKPAAAQGPLIIRKKAS